MREALLFCFNLKKSAAESHRMLVKAYGDNALSETTCRDWFTGPMATILTWVTRSVKIGPGRLRTVNCRLFWTKTIPNRKSYQSLIKLHRALREKRSYYRKRHDKLIFLHDNAPSHTSTIVQNYLETLNWEVLSHPVYSPDLAPSNYYCFRRGPRARSLSGTSILTKTAPKMAPSGLLWKMRHFFGVVYTNCPKDGKNV